eukprot:6792114-Prymnesium_polylepis.1
MHDDRAALPSTLAKSFKYDEPRKLQKLRSLFKMAREAVELCPLLDADLEVELYALTKQARAARSRTARARWTRNVAARVPGGVPA